MCLAPDEAEVFRSRDQELLLQLVDQRVRSGDGEDREDHQQHDAHKYPNRVANEDYSGYRLDRGCPIYEAEAQEAAEEREQHDGGGPHGG
eukprot:CAMPEP_0173349550 /NCGR_PEP_ID=MMETSP1144-20121109/14381_1 /TAXON_ID=483371 /ORGANISM="non described non described, Strain CCMP2298" /LENGTH=89 /DNA_ID=CAMNT_0014297379 /DNA_START=308 /DNA_END=578 /DNA_ORIENTATION=+